MRTMRLKICVLFGLFAGCFLAADTFAAAPATLPASTITMKSFSTFIVNEREVAASDLIKALKKNKIPMDSPLIVEVPAHTSMEVIRDLTQRLASAGYKPLCRGPRHAAANVVTQGGATNPTAPLQKKQKRQQ